jgi:protein TonB
LGGAALIGGLYFGGGMPNFASGPQEEQVADAGPPPAAYDEPADASTLDEPTGVPIEDIATPARRTETAARRETPEPARREERPRREEAAPPPPVTSWSGANGQPTSGPTSLSPGSTGASSTTAPPALATSVPSPTTTISRPTTTIRQGSVVWAQRPTARRISELYPERAGRDGVGGRVELDCSVRTNMSLACSVASESPSGLGFGRAALNAAASYRSRGALSDGADATGARTRIVVQFQAPAN